MNVSYTLASGETKVERFPNVNHISLWGDNILTIRGSLDNGIRYAYSINNVVKHFEA